MSGIDGLRVAVLLGGLSSEREVSLVTGEAVVQALRPQVREVVAIDADRDVASRLREAEPDVVFVALHGPFGEDGTIQGLLDLMGYRYTGSGVLASALAMHKLYSKRLFKYHRIPTPDFAVITRRDAAVAPSLPASLGEPPVVVKPCRGGSTIGISVIQERGEFPEACERGFAEDDTLLVERYVPGRELTVGILDDVPLPVVEILPRSGFYDYEAKYDSRGETDYKVPAAIPNGEYRRIQELGLQAHRSLGCRHFSRVDLRMDPEGRPWVLEVNTIPGLTPQSLLPKAANFVGIEFDQLVASMVRLAVKEEPQAPEEGQG